MSKRLSFQEYMKKNPVKCKTCKTILCSDSSAFMSAFLRKEIHRLIDVDGERIKGFLCSNCIEQARKDLMESRLFEEYKGSKIYRKDDMYLPYWDCAYHFKTVEECRIRIDANISIMKRGIADLKGIFS